MTRNFPKMPLAMYTRPSVIPLLFVVFLCCFASVAAASGGCGFGEVMKQAGTDSVAVVREVPRAGQSGVQVYTAAGKTWAPIRVQVFSKDLEDSSKYCTEVGRKQSDFIRRKIKCAAGHILTDSKKMRLLKHIIPGAIKLHTERLSVMPVTGVIRVPKFKKGELCAPFTIPSEHHTTGISGADFVLYVAAGPSDGSVAWAGPCARLKNKRPIVAGMNYNPMFIDTADKSIRIVAHEIGHALGFGFTDMSMRNILHRNFKVRGKSRATIVSSPLVQQMVRKHYGCPDAEGMELEDEGLSGTSFSHWERRNAKDELMVGLGGNLRYTAITMALFEDLGYYKADFSKAETMRWGKDAGCDFLRKPCFVDGVSPYPDMFCNQPMDNKSLLCTFDRLSLGFCTLNKYAQHLPQHFQYFKDPTLGGVGLLADHCPFVHEYANTGCTNGNASVMPGSRIGPNSRCLKGNSLRMENRSLDDVCVNTQCDKGILRVQLLDDDTWYTCKEGEYITPRKVFTSGTILCPKYEEVCTEVSEDNNDADPETSLKLALPERDRNRTRSEKSAGRRNSSSRLNAQRRPWTD